ncbi:uncharacterized protein PV06_03326 [Exophiala oligosperma]|uniref:Zn(2)-C6 fungal-type domain-containing protein n=1 Tax=Exophiala oligosperma TaxID=215243 RepID=A0A0D2DPX7_9EURO|nr:uncharacterized protein PV06_03326 [Exophiala oligosperma]KIW44888.1 hypothetical protein PV06_03326 [Exophiala oligosperma]
MPAAPQRRFHKKSRHGCVQCKKNRTKCDEQRPTCGRCTRTGQCCSLNSPDCDLLIIIDENDRAAQGKVATTATSASSTSLLLSTTSSSSPSQTELSGISITSPSSNSHASSSSSIFNINEPQLPFTTLERDRLRLMHHYDRFTCETVADLVLPTPEGVNIMRHYVPELAFEHDFLLHGILALSSLHLTLLSLDNADAQTRERHLSLATYHHSCAIRMFNRYLADNPADHNIDALFLFSSQIAMCAFGFQRVTTRGSQEKSLEQIVEMLNLLRGTGTVAKSSFHKLVQGRLSPLFFQARRALAGGSEELSVGVETVLSNLLDRALKIDSPQRELYLDALAALRLNLTLASAVSIPHQAPISTFPVISPPGFFQIVATGDALALALVANYGIIVHWLRGNIWLAEWGKQTAQTIKAALPPDWDDCLLNLREVDWKYSGCGQLLAAR